MDKDGHVLDNTNDNADDHANLNGPEITGVDDHNTLEITGVADNNDNEQHTTLQNNWQPDNSNINKQYEQYNGTMMRTYQFKMNHQKARMSQSII